MRARQTKPEPIAKTRDRSATTQAIVDAAKETLAEDGFQNFGVNAIARRAVCDKQLIYRYFGNLEGLCEAVGEELARDLTEKLSAVATVQPRTYGAMVETLALRLLELLLSDPILRQINVWETAAPSPLVAKLSAARSKRMMQWMAELRGDLRPPDGVDAPAINAIIVAGVQQLAVAGAASGAFSGMALKSEADWKRARAAVSALVRSVYSA